MKARYIIVLEFELPVKRDAEKEGEQLARDIALMFDAKEARLEQCWELFGAEDA